MPLPAPRRGRLAACCLLLAATLGACRSQPDAANRITAATLTGAGAGAAIGALAGGVGLIPGAVLGAVAGAGVQTATGHPY